MSPEDLFKRATEAGITMDDLSHHTSIHRATFVRWKKGDGWDEDTLAKAVGGLDEMILAKAQKMLGLIEDRLTNLLSLKQPS